MKKNLGGFDRGVRWVLAAVFLFAGLHVYQSALGQAVIIVFALWLAYEAAFGVCPLMAHLGVTSLKDTLKPEKLFFLGLAAIQGLLAYEWIGAGIEKLMEPKFCFGMTRTLMAFADKNPYPFYQNFLLGFASDHAQTFGLLVSWGEFLIGVALAVSVFVMLYRKNGEAKGALEMSVPTLVIGAFMSANFYLAAGWMSPSTHSLNLVMFWSQLVLAYVWMKMIGGKA